MPDPVLRLDELSYSYPGATEPALEAASLTVEAGEFVVVAGRSAAGKSTLLQVGCGLVPHFQGGEISGRAVVAGRDIRAERPAQLATDVGYVAQEPETQVISTTVAAELSLPLEMRGEASSAQARAVEEVALALAIPHLLGRTVDTLSGGELQRVALAAALVGRPRLVLLDEPTSQLDPVAGDELIWLLRRLNSEWGMAILLCEHRLERCLAAADRVLAMAAGRIAFDGKPQDFLEWAISNDPALATPAAQLFHRAGISPLPVGVKDARARLAELASGNGASSPPAPRNLVSRNAHPPADAALTCRDLWVELEGDEGPREVLRGMDLEIAAGERVALMGRNGAGKSTLLRCAAGLVRPVRGRIEAPGGVALLSQSPGDFLVRERVHDELPGEAGAAALDRVGLAAKADSDPRDLSGGERQRLALAIVLAGRGSGDGPPALVMLDEPTRGMDRAHKHDLSSLIKELSTAGTAMIVATHDVEFAAEFADRVVLLGDGETIADGSSEEILTGGWYFATEVARILDRPGIMLPDQAAASLVGP